MKCRACSGSRSREFFGGEGVDLDSLVAGAVGGTEESEIVFGEEARDVRCAGERVAGCVRQEAVTHRAAQLRFDWKGSLCVCERCIEAPEAELVGRWFVDAGGQAFAHVSVVEHHARHLAAEPVVRPPLAATERECEDP